MNNEILGNNSVLFFEDYSSKDLKKAQIGRKGLSLFRLKDMDVPVPDFFVISGDVFTKFCFEILDENKKKLLLKNKKDRKSVV